MSFKYLTSSFSKSKYFFILLEKIKSLSSGSTESKPIRNLAFTLEDNKLRTSFELKKLIKSIGEKCKVSIRNIRREANEELKKLLKSKEIGEDEEKSSEKNVQTITDDHIKVVDEKVSLKEKEIMTI